MLMRLFCFFTYREIISDKVHITFHILMIDIQCHWFHKIYYIRHRLR